ncbi:MAG TPA: carbonic anhydrase [Enteractinococcus helveticum]|uniref:Carbonic anhydrase n=1 Tax=Enteractinococcus helveticum TaxID=1837282 RepID=A0A921FKS7_9MICC|nr:carbonic anhydrase [Enteractinococcus helveticum]HJF13454.1 carbonic anhydrase [Enteractinococcus helveticum]
MSTTLTPQQAWEQLKAGNRRFVDGTVDHPHQDAGWRATLENSQSPHAVIFGCADSRLAAEIIFDVGLGDVFVIRTAGQVIDDAVLGSLQFAIEEIDVPLIIILGHDNCGAVTAAVEAVQTAVMPKSFMRSLVERIMPSVMAARSKGITDVNGTVEEHTDQTVHRVVDTSYAVAQAVKEGRTAVMGVTYSLSDGSVKIGDILGPVNP